MKEPLRRVQIWALGKLMGRSTRLEGIATVRDNCRSIDHPSHAKFYPTESVAQPQSRTSYSCAVTPSACPGQFKNDLFVIDPIARTSVDLTSAVHGTPPTQRSFFVYTAFGGKLYVMGGFFGSGNASSTRMKQEIIWSYPEVWLHKFSLCDCAST